MLQMMMTLIATLQIFIKLCDGGKMVRKRRKKTPDDFSRNYEITYDGLLEKCDSDLEQ